MKLIAKKHMNTNQVADYEIVTNHMKPVFNITYEEIESFYLIDLACLDSEEVCQYGVAVDYNDDIVFIDVDRLIEYLKDEMEDFDTSDEGEAYKYEKFENLKTRLEDYAGYILYPQEEEKENEN